MKYLLPLMLAALLLLVSEFDTDYQKEKRQHVVKAGETVWQIAWQYMDRQDRYKDVRELVHDISKENGGNMIRPGDVLDITLWVKK